MSETQSTSPTYGGDLAGTFAGGIFTPLNQELSYASGQTDIYWYGNLYPGNTVGEQPVGVVPAYPSFPVYDGYFLYQGNEYPLVAYQSTPTSAHPISTNSYYLLEPVNGQPELNLSQYTINTSATTAFSPSVACFLRGTSIGTPEGEQLVESLVIGDIIVTASGQRRPIKWIGRRSYADRFLASNPNVQPIRFHTGSLGNGLPRRELLVSPKHAMFLDGVLVPAECLVGGNTIVRERSLDRVDYFHIELDSHDVLLAEGSPSESFVDDDSRGVFQNAAEWQQVYPSRERVPAVYCAPRVEGGFKLEAIRQRLAMLASEVVSAA